MGGTMGGMAISFPFRIDSHTGGVVTTPEGSVQHTSEAVAVHVLTHPGERHLNPGFGYPTLPFSAALEAGPLQLNLTDNGLGHVRITDVTTELTGEGSAESMITWEVA